VPWNDTAAFTGAPVRASSSAQQPPKQKPKVASLRYRPPPRLLLQLLERRLHALAQQCAIVLQRHHRRAGLISILRTHGLPVQVGNQHHVALGRDFLGDLFGTCADAHPVRRHQQARAAPLCSASNARRPS
jgi:hypothetical protein